MSDHPYWCDQTHNPEYGVHTRDVEGDGSGDLPIDHERDIAVSLYQEAGKVPQVWIAEHGRMVTAVTSLTVDTARELGARLVSAADLADDIEVGDESR